MLLKWSDKQIFGWGDQMQAWDADQNGIWRWVCSYITQFDAEMFVVCINNRMEGLGVVVVPLTVDRDGTTITTILNAYKLL
jgi:hypothetical protein